MNSLSQAKTLGGVGSLLVVLSIVPSVGPILGIVGFILVLIAVKYISESVGNRFIFNNMLWATILSIIGLVAALVIGVAGFLVLLGAESGFFEPGLFGRSLEAPGFLSFISAIILGLMVIWVFFILSAIFLRRSFTAIASSLNITMFSTAALLYLIGAALAIIVVGFIIIFVAAILQTVAFFSIPERAPGTQQTQTTQSPTQ